MVQRKKLVFNVQLRKMNQRLEQPPFCGAVSPARELAQHLKAGGRRQPVRHMLFKVVAIWFKGRESREGESQLPRETGFT